MMSQNFPKLDISKLLSCKILCTEHAKLDGYIDHICSFPGCEFSKMVCPICKETDPEHYKQHMAYMKRPEDLKNTLMNENDEFHHIVNDSIITANEVLIAQLDNSLEKEKEKLDNFFKEISQKFINEVENMKVEIYTQIVKKYYSEIKEDFQDFYSEKYQKFHGNILVHFLNYHKISQNNEKISSKEFENMVNLIFNSRIVAIQLKNLKDEKVKSILQNLPKIENFNIDDFLKKITNIFTNSYKSLYYPISPSMSPIKTSPISLNPFNSIKRGCTFEEKTRNFDSDEEEFGLMINKTPEELSNKVCLENLAEATKTLLLKTLPELELEISISLPVAERQDKEMEILGRVFKKMSENDKKIKKLDLDCASKSQGRRSATGCVSDEGIELFSQGLNFFNKTIEKLRLDFSLNDGISDCGMKNLLAVIRKMEVLKNLNLEFYMNTRITDKILVDVENLQDLPKIEEIQINFTKTRVTKEMAEKTISLLKNKANIKKIEIFANI